MTNLLTNGGMEGTFVAGIAPAWALIAALPSELTASQDTSYPVAGSSSQKFNIAGAVNGDSGGIYQVVTLPTSLGAVLRAQPYCMSLHVMTDIIYNSDWQWGFKVKWYDISSTLLQTDIATWPASFYNNAGVAGAWDRYSLFVTCPVGAVTARIELIASMNNNDVANGNVYFDGVQFEYCDLYATNVPTPPLVPAPVSTPAWGTMQFKAGLGADNFGDIMPDGWDYAPTGQGLNEYLSTTVPALHGTALLLDFGSAFGSIGQAGVAVGTDRSRADYVIGGSTAGSYIPDLQADPNHYAYTVTVKYQVTSPLSANLATWLRIRLVGGNELTDDTTVPDTLGPSAEGISSGWQTLTITFGAGSAHTTGGCAFTPTGICIMVGFAASAIGAGKNGTIVIGEVTIGLGTNASPPAQTYGAAGYYPTALASIVSGASAMSATGSARMSYIGAIPGTGNVKIVMAGQDISSSVPFDGMGQQVVQIVSALAQGAGVGLSGSGRAATASFITELGPPSSAIGAGTVPNGHQIVRQGEVIIYDALGTRLFGGFASKLTDATQSIIAATQVDCVDYWQSLDRIEVNVVYTGRSDTYIIKDLLTTYAPWVDQSRLPSTDNYQFSRRFIRAKTLREAIQGVADTIGYAVWIDPNGVIYYMPPTTVPSAPFSLSDMPNSTTSFGHQITSYVTDDNAIINRVIFFGGKNTSPDFTQDLNPQANGVNTTMILAYFPHDSSDGTIHVKKNGVDLVVGSPFDTTSLGKLISAGGTADVLLNRDSQVLTFNVAPLHTDTLVCIYRYQTPLVVVLANAASHTFFGRYFDGKITDEQVFDVATALQRCRVLLAEQAFGLTSIKLSTWTGGLMAGMLLHLVNSVRQIDATVLIQKVTINPIGGGFFQYDLEIGDWNWNLLDLVMQSARQLGPTDTATEEDNAIIVAQEVVLTNTSAIAIVKQTRTSGVYYSRTVAVGDDHDAYSGLSTVTS